MCGIFAIINQNHYDINDVKRHFDMGKKRGPEYSSFNILSNFVTFGFHRLAINGLDNESNQPLRYKSYYLICNGEIYNHHELKKRFNLQTKTNSDCEVILQLYDIMGEKCVAHLDGVFSFILYDELSKKVLVSRDPFGVRPLYICYQFNGVFSFCSDLKPLLFDKNINSVKSINQFTPGTYMMLENKMNRYIIQTQQKYYYTEQIYYPNFPYIYGKEFYLKNLYDLFCNAVKKRVENCERPIACLLSGGLDSSLICALVARYYKEKTGKQVETYSIGLEGSEDLQFASRVADHIGTKHTQVLMKNEEFLDSIPNVIEDIESYDTTTVRASVGNWNIGKYIKENSDAKVIFNGDGADELMGGYLYFHLCPNNHEFDSECRRLLNDISHFDVLRSDKCISSHGLEPRTPFLDKEFVTYYLSIPVEYRNHALNEYHDEKQLFRAMIEQYDPDLIPRKVLFRRKEAFSDGVSSNNKSWFEIIGDHMVTRDIDISIRDDFTHNTPKTREQIYYRDVFEQIYPNCGQVVPYFWMPRYVDAPDCSARTLAIYHKNRAKLKEDI